MSEKSSPTVPLLHNRNFWLFVINRSSNVIGIHSLTVAVGWHIYKLTGDPLDLGLIGLAQFAPALILFLVAGMAADRFDRRWIMILCNVVHGLAVSSLIALFWYGLGTVWPILAILSVHGVARSFYHTASQAILPNLMPRDQFPKAVAYSSSANKAAQLAGPAFGGFLIAGIGDGVYGFILLMFVVASIAAILISGNLKVSIKEPVSLQTIMGGFTYIWNNKIVLGAVSIDLLAVLFGGVMGLLPVFASDILHVGPSGLGVMRAMPGFGSLIVGVLLTQIAAPRYMGPTLFFSLAVFGLSITVFSLSETFWISLLALGIYGAADMVSVYVRQTLVQIATPDAMRGRVSAVNAVSINASNELGDFRAGVMAGGIGTVPAVLVGGLTTVAVTVLWMKLFPSISRIDRLDQIDMNGTKS